MFRFLLEFSLFADSDRVLVARFKLSQNSNSNVQKWVLILLESMVKGYLHSAIYGFLLTGLTMQFYCENR